MKIARALPDKVLAIVISFPVYNQAAQLCGKALHGKQSDSEGETTLTTLPFFSILKTDSNVC